MEKGKYMEAKELGGRKERIVNAINYLSEKLFSELSHDNEKTDDRQKVKGKECGYYDN